MAEDRIKCEYNQMLPMQINMLDLEQKERKK